MADLSPDYSKRDYLLPPGCKDLIDVLHLKMQSHGGKGTMGSISKWFAPSPPKAKSPLAGTTVEIKPPIVVRELAELIQVKPFYIVADLLECGLFVGLNSIVNFDAAVTVLAKYGVSARKIS
jgi:hypothetical protein